MPAVKVEEVWKVFGPVVVAVVTAGLPADGQPRRIARAGAGAGRAAAGCR